MAEPLGHIRTFAEHGPALADLLAKVPASSGVSCGYIERLIAACSAPPNSMTSDRTTRLSRRELEVLRHIEDGLSNRRIADALFVSVGTIKRQTNSIYSKLNVGSRTQALARARTLNLLGA